RISAGVGCYVGERLAHDVQQLPCNLARHRAPLTHDEQLRAQVRDARKPVELAGYPGLEFDAIEQRAAAAGHRVPVLEGSRRRLPGEDDSGHRVVTVVGALDGLT